MINSGSSVNVFNLIEKRITKINYILNNNQLKSEIEDVASEIICAMMRNKKLFICGNGGSAADSMHFSSELVGRFKVTRRPLPAIALNSDIAAITSIANDFAFDEVFSRQLKALASEGDILVVLSTSGNSTNIVNALEYANANNILTVGILGNQGGLAVEKLDKAIIVDDTETAIIQEIQKIIIHIICELIDHSEIAKSK